MRKFLSVVCSSFLIASPGWTMRHIQPDAYPKAFQDQMHRPSKAQIHAAGTARAAIISSASGPKTIAVILVQFPSADGSWTSGSRTIQSYANIASYFSNISAYFSEASYNNLTLSFKFFGATAPNQDVASDAGAYTLAHSMEYYGCGDEGTGCSGVTTPTSPAIGANGNYLIRDALNAAGGAVNSTSFAAVIVMHAGNGNETTLADGDIWSIYYSDDAIIQSAGTGFNEGDVVPETEASGISSPMGVICHEFGHALGLPDLYNTGSAGGTSVVGDWDLMDSGPFDGSGANPAHPGAWDKLALGWATVQTVTTRDSYTLNPVETNSRVIKLPVQNGLPQEYFLIEYRLRTSGAAYDQSIPGDGLIIWHVDDAITASRGVTATDQSVANTVNSGSPHYGVSIVTANGIAISGSNQGSSGNTFGGERRNFISPQSNNFNGDASGISVVNISGVGTDTTRFDVANLAVTADQSISKVISYPNPAGKGYAHPSGEGHATLQFHLTRPANDYQINIYTLSGDLVRKISKEEIALNIDRSDNLKWVYEFVWDLKNGDGALVAPGVYLYLVRADNKSKGAKAVIIR
ncbi:MAG: M6 family metalloprotease domain-containing protein [Elusimicrobiota bacterium]